MIIILILLLTIFLILGLFLICCVKLLGRIEELDEVKDEKREDKD